MEGESVVVKQEPEEEQERSESLSEETSEQGELESNASTSSKVAETVKFDLVSPMDGRIIEFRMVNGIANKDSQDELKMHLTNFFSLGVSSKAAFEKNEGCSWNDFPWSQADRVGPVIQRINRAVRNFISLSGGVSRPRNPSEWFNNTVCTAEQCKKIAFTVFNRVVTNARILNQCYKSFSSLTYGETSFDQVQIILDRLQMTEKDVFVDLGSGVGHVVTYAAGYSQAGKCVGIEVNEFPATKGIKMKEEFESMMKWYGKEYRPLELIHGNFLDKKYRDLILEEATVIYLNNFAFQPDLMFDIRQLIMEMRDGTRIVCTKSLSEERDDKNNEVKRPVSNRTISRQSVDMMLDSDELPVSDAPVSWSTGKGVKFLMFTVNSGKIAGYYESPNKDKPKPAKKILAPAPTEDTSVNSINTKIGEIASAKEAANRVNKMSMEDSGEEGTDDGDEDYQAPGSGRKKVEKRRRGDHEQVPKKRSSTGASGSRHNKKEQKKDNKSSSTEVSRRISGSTSKAGTPMQRDTKVKKEPSSGRARKNGDNKENGEEEEESPEGEKEEEEEKEPEPPKSVVELYGPAATGHSLDYDKESAPVWAAKEGPVLKKAKSDAATTGPTWMAVYAPHHSIFEEDYSGLPKLRRRSAANGATTTTPTPKPPSRSTSKTPKRAASKTPGNKKQ